MIQVNVNPVDASGQPVPAPIITLFSYDARGLPCPIEPAIRNQTNFYSSDNPYTPVDAGGKLFVTPFSLYGMVTAPSFNAAYFGPVSWDGRSTLDIPVPCQSFKRPFRPAPRVWAANMCGTRVAGVPNVPGGSSDPSLVLSWFLDRYNADDRQRIYAAWREEAFTHCLLSWPDSRAVGATPQTFTALCQEVIAAGFAPAVMLCSKVYDPTDAPGILANIAPVLPLLVGVVPVFCLGWELNLWLSPQVVATLRDTLCPNILGQEPRTLIYAHFGPGVFAWQFPGQPTSAFWNASVGKLTGVFHQRDPDEDKGVRGEYQARITDCLERFNGADGFVTDSGFGHPFDFVALEITASQQFDGSMTESQGNEWGQAALATPPSGQVHVMGSGNGQ